MPAINIFQFPPFIVPFICNKCTVIWNQFQKLQPFGKFHHSIVHSWCVPFCIAIGIYVYFKKLQNAKVPLRIWTRFARASNDQWMKQETISSNSILNRYRYRSLVSLCVWNNQRYTWRSEHFSLTTLTFTAENHNVEYYLYTHHLSTYSELESNGILSCTHIKLNVLWCEH